jgi:hypothetical protein
MNPRQTPADSKGYKQTPMEATSNQLRHLTVEELATEELAVEMVELGNLVEARR